MGTSAFNTHATNEFFEESLLQEWYVSGRGPLSVSNGQSLRLYGINPVGSNVLIMVHRLRAWASTKLEDMEIRVNPTGNLPTFSIPSSNVRLGGPAGALVLTCSTGVAMSGGSALPYRIPIEDGSIRSFTEFTRISPYVVPPGYAMGISCLNATGGPSDMTIVVDWKEEPVR